MSRSLSRLLPPVCAALAVAVAATACGSSGSVSAEQRKSAASVLSDAKAAFTAAKAVHVQGSMGSGSSAETLNLQVQTNQSAGTLTTDGTTLKIVNTGTAIYLNAPAAFWTQNAGAGASVLAGKWISVTTAQAGQAADITLAGLAQSLTDSDSPLKAATTVGSVGGQKAIILTQQDGSELFVADSTTPLPLKIVNRGSDAGTLTFTGYGKTQTIAAPPGALTPQQALTGGGAST